MQLLPYLARPARTPPPAPPRKSGTPSRLQLYDVDALHGCLRRIRRRLRMPFCAFCDRDRVRTGVYWTNSHGSQICLTTGSAHAWLGSCSPWRYQVRCVLATIGCGDRAGCRYHVHGRQMQFSHLKGAAKSGRQPPQFKGVSAGQRHKCSRALPLWLRRLTAARGTAHNVSRPARRRGWLQLSAA